MSPVMFDEEYPEPLPLAALPAESRAEIERLAALETPPPKWRTVMCADDGRPMAQIMSRAFFEWHLRRGRDVRRHPEGVS